MINKKFTLKGSIILIILILVSTTLTFSKVRVNVDGTININLGKGKSNNQDIIIWDDNPKYSTVGDITDRQYILKPFLMNGKGYAVIKSYDKYYILQVDFYNGNPNNVKKEVVFDARVQSSNCLSIEGDNRYCLTITPKGQPALWDRYSSRIKYTGQWVRNNYNNYYDNSYDYYQNSNQSWFEW